MAIDTNETKNQLFGNIRKLTIGDVFQDERSGKEIESSNSSVSRKTEEIKPHSESQLKDLAEPSKAKWNSFDKVTALLTSEQKEGLDRIAKKIMKFRSKDPKIKDNFKERITANTLLRALIENFLKKEESIPMEVLCDEEDVCEWVGKLFYSNFRT